MAVLSGKDSVFHLGKYPLTNFLNKVTPHHTNDKNDTSVFGTSKSSVPGQAEGIFDITGWFDPAVGAYSDALTAYLGGVPVPATLGLPGAAFGDFAAFINGVVMSKNLVADVNSAVSLMSQVIGQDAMDYGAWIHILGAETSTGNSAGYLDNGAAGTNGWAANLHVTATAGASPSTVIIVQQSTDHSTWTTLGTFTAATAATAQHLTGTGAVNRYIRALWTLGGSTTSITFSLAFAYR